MALRTLLFVKFKNEEGTFLSQNFRVVDADTGSVIYTFRQSPLSMADVAMTGISASAVQRKFQSVLLDSNEYPASTITGNGMKGFQPRCVLTDSATGVEYTIKSRFLSYTQDTFGNGSRMMTFISPGWTVFNSTTRIVDAAGKAMGELRIVNAFAEKKTRKNYPTASECFSDDAVLRMVMTMNSETPESLPVLLCNAYFLSFRKLV